MRAFCRLWMTVLAILLTTANIPRWVAAEDWPAWRGAQYDGHSTETDCPLSWDIQTNVKWRIPIHGEGHSSPIVYQNQIFVTTALRDDLSRRLLCIERESGEVDWEVVVATAPIEEMHRDNTAASATPITDGEMIFVAFCVAGRLQVSAYDLQGKHRWTSFPGKFYSRHGFSTALMLDDNRLYLSGLQDGEDAFVAALEKETGETLWRVPRPRLVRSFSVPQLCTFDSKPAFILSGSEQTIVYDRLTGETLLEIEGPAEKTVSSVVVCEQSQLAFVCGGRDKQLLAIRLSGAPTGNAEDRVAWKASRAIPYMTSPLVSQGRLHVLSDEGVYSCYNAESGQLLNQMRTVGPVRASMIATRSQIYVTEKSGRTTVIANDSNWQVLAVNELGEEVYASPALSNGDLVFRTVNHLVLIRQDSTGAE